MLSRSLFLAALPLSAAACGAGDNTPTPPATAAPADSSVAAAGALGLTEAQLRDADLIDAAGMDLGDVEYVVRGSDGAIIGLVVEIEDTHPDRLVQIPLEGLEPVRRGNDVDLRSSATRESLMALPEVSRR